MSNNVTWRSSWYDLSINTMCLLRIVYEKDMYIPGPCMICIYLNFQIQNFRSSKSVLRDKLRERWEVSERLGNEVQKGLNSVNIIFHFLLQNVIGTLALYSERFHMVWERPIGTRELFISQALYPKMWGTNGRLPSLSSFQKYFSYVRAHKNGNEKRCAMDPIYGLQPESNTEPLDQQANI